MFATGLLLVGRLLSLPPPFPCSPYPLTGNNTSPIVRFFTPGLLSL